MQSIGSIKALLKADTLASKGKRFFLRAEIPEQNAWDSCPFLFCARDGTKLKHPPVIDGDIEPKKAEAYSNKLIFFVGCGLFGRLFFVFFAAS